MPKTGKTQKVVLPAIAGATAGALARKGVQAGLKALRQKAKPSLNKPKPGPRPRERDVDDFSTGLEDKKSKTNKNAPSGRSPKVKTQKAVYKTSRKPQPTVRKA